MRDVFQTNATRDAKIKALLNGRQRSELNAFERELLFVYLYSRTAEELLRVDYTDLEARLANLIGKPS